ncbi:MAG: hypothetical protein J6U20_01520 [Fibrobacter sp.]|nr:hypothetical protein [Fibrobacter sp.]
MKKFMCMALGAFALLACSESSQSVGGTTEDPNTLAQNSSSSSVPSSYSPRYALCRTSAEDNFAKPSEAEACDWYAEMWNPGLGYRVRTGFDNGTNTSGIWYLTFDSTELLIPSFKWLDEVDDKYDSLSMSKVIDACHGEICGMARFETVHNGAEQIEEAGYALATIGFSLSGKNASGQFDEVDVSDLNGLCVGYSTEGMPLLVLDFSDSINALLGSRRYAVRMERTTKDARGVDVSSKKECYAWDDFKLMVIYEKEKTAESTSISVYDAIKHLVGIRFVFHSIYPNHYEVFRLSQIGWYSQIDNIKRNEENSLPVVAEDCESPEIEESFCSCNYADSVAIRDGNRLGVDSGWTEAVEKYGDMIYGNLCVFDFSLESYGSVWLDFSSKKQPCDNPVSKIVRCSDGSRRISEDFSYVKSAYDSIVEYVAMETKLRILDKIDSCMEFASDLNHLKTFNEKFSESYDELSDYGELWNFLKNEKVQTSLYADSTWPQGTSNGGEWFYESDSVKGGSSSAFYWGLEDYEGASIDEIRADRGHLHFEVTFTKKQHDPDPYGDIGFYVAGFDSNGNALPADISNWNGICVVYSTEELSSILLELMLDLGDSINRDLAYDLPKVTLPLSQKYQEFCFAWSDFKQGGWGKEKEGYKYSITGDDAAQKAVKIFFRLSADSRNYLVDMLKEDDSPIDWEEKVFGMYFDLLGISANRD